jgi:exonuclease V gamma subunit
MGQQILSDKVTILKENCDPKDAQDRSLPYTAYLVEYKLDTKTRYDLVIAQKAVDLFDHYYDNYRKDFVGWKQSEGRINPKLWQPPGAKQPKKKK